MKWLLYNALFAVAYTVMEGIIKPIIDNQL